MAVVGIDLGTTNTVIAAVRDGQVRVLTDDEGSHLLPSVVSFHPGGDVLVGQEAKNRRLIDAKNTIASIKRLIGRPWDSDEMRIARSRFSFELREGAGQGALVLARGETYTLPEISAFVLKRAKQIAEAALGEEVDKAVITVPAHFNELQRASTKVAGRVAGLEVLRILNEPTAAALAYGFGSERTERVVVYDFGGGTFDCSVLDLTGTLFEVLATGGDTFLGGDDVDTAIADVMCSAFLAEHRYDPRVDPQAFERLRAAAEELKKTLSVEDEAQIDVPEVAYGVEGRALGFTFGMTRSDLDALATPFVERTLAVTQDALNIAHLTTTAFDQIILVGGSTRMPIVRRRVADFFGMAVNDSVNPDEVVAVGAAVQAAALMDQSRARSIPKAPTPGIIGRPQAIDEAVPYGRGTNRPSKPPVPGARASAAPEKRVHETLRPKVGVPPPAPPESKRGGRTKPGLVDDDDGPSLGSNQTMPAGVDRGATGTLSAASIKYGSPLGPESIRGRTSPMAPAVDPGATKKRPGWREASPLDTDEISLIRGASIVQPSPPPSNPPSAPASNSLSPYGVKVGPLETEDISRISDAPPGPPPRGFPSNRPSAPPSRPLSPRGVNVGPLSTEDISIMSGPGGRSVPGATSVSLGSFDLPARPAADLPSPLGGPPSMDVPTRAGVSPGLAAAAPPPFSPPNRRPPPPPPPPPFAMPSAEPSMASGSLSSSISFDVSSMPQAQPQAEWAPAKPPILVDVTPCALVVETVGGYCDTVIPRNATIPCEHTRVFATGRDLQTMVHVRVAQGEKERFDENQYLGEVEVSNLRPAPRGDVLLSVTFEIDANGSLVVRAVDASTGRRAQAAMKLIAVTQSEEEIEEMMERSLSVSVKARAG